VNRIRWRGLQATEPVERCRASASTQPSKRPVRQSTMKYFLRFHAVPGRHLLSSSFLFLALSDQVSAYQYCHHQTTNKGQPATPSTTPTTNGLNHQHQGRHETLNSRLTSSPLTACSRPAQPLLRALRGGVYSWASLLPSAMASTSTWVWHGLMGARTPTTWTAARNRASASPNLTRQPHATSPACCCPAAPCTPK